MELRHAIESMAAYQPQRDEQTDIELRRTAYKRMIASR